MGLLDRLAGARSAERPVPQPPPAVAADERTFATQALRKFLTALSGQESPVVLDLGPVVGSNVSFLGEQLGCKLWVEDIFAKLDRQLLEGPLPQATASVDGILCWDLLDYVDKSAAQVLANELTRILRPKGVLLGFFSTAPQREVPAGKYIIVDDVHVTHRLYGEARRRQVSLLNRDIIRLFSGLRVTESFLLRNNLREILFRKPN